MDDYKNLILGTEPKTRRKSGQAAAEPAIAAAPVRQLLPLKKRVAAIEEKMAKFQDLIGRIDKALSDRDAFLREPAKAAQLGKQRSDLARALSVAEEDWLALTAEQDAAQ